MGVLSDVVLFECSFVLDPITFMLLTCTPPSVFCFLKYLVNRRFRSNQQCMKKGHRRSLNDNDEDRILGWISLVSWYETPNNEYLSACLLIKAITLLGFLSFISWNFLHVFSNTKQYICGLKREINLQQINTPGTYTHWQLKLFNHVDLSALRTLGVTPELAEG